MSNTTVFDQPAGGAALKLSSPQLPFGGVHDFAFNVTGNASNTWGVNICLRDRWVPLVASLGDDDILTVSREGGVFVGGTRYTGPGITVLGVEFTFSGAGSAQVSATKTLQGF